MSDSVTPWIVTHQAPLSMGFPRQEYWSGLPFPSPEDLSDSGIAFASLTSPALAGRFFFCFLFFVFFTTEGHLVKIGIPQKVALTYICYLVQNT